MGDDLPEAPGRPASVGVVWQPSAVERLAIAQGACIEVVSAGHRMAPMLVRINPHQLGRSPAAACVEDGHEWSEGERCERCDATFTGIFGR